MSDWIRIATTLGKSARSFISSARGGLRSRAAIRHATHVSCPWVNSTHTKSSFCRFVPRAYLSGFCILSFLVTAHLRYPVHEQQCPSKHSSRHVKFACETSEAAVLNFTDAFSCAHECRSSKSIQKVDRNASVHEAVAGCAALLHTHLPLAKAIAHFKEKPGDELTPLFSSFAMYLIARYCMSDIMLKLCA